MDSFLELFGAWLPLEFKVAARLGGSSIKFGFSVRLQIFGIAVILLAFLFLAKLIELCCDTIQKFFS